jgi:RHS repeat-associated protein
MEAPPAESDWTLEARAAMLEADGLPAEVTFAWDPLSDRLVSLHAAGASGGSGDPYGGVVRQIVHGGMGYDDPLEVTVRTREGAGERLTRLYPVFGEAADGLLDVILNERGELVARNVPNDPYGGGSELSAGGASIDRIAVTAKKDGEGEVTEVEVTLRATDALAGPTLATGLRLAAVDGQGRLVRSSNAAAQLFENDANSARFVLTRSEWNALVSTEPETVGGEERIAAAISIAATKHLRAAAWADQLPIAAAPEWATVTRPVYTSPELPIEVRESLASLASFLTGIPAGSERSTTLYEIEGLALLASADPNPAIAQLGIATFHAYPFTEPANGKVYARARWYDPQTGTFMSPDPMGYVDSSNMYAFAGGDPVNGRDPTGRYQADVHYGLTYVLALKAGFSDAQAKVIALAAESPDQDSERDPIMSTIRYVLNTAFGTIMRGPRGAKLRQDAAELALRIREDHFPRSDEDPNVVSPFSRESQARLVEARKTGSLVLFGEGLHTLQDSMAHRGLPSLGVSGHPVERGGVLSKDTDIPAEFPRHALDAAKATYDALASFRHSRSGRPEDAAKWSDIESEVKEFVNLRERADKKMWLLARGVTMPAEYWNDVTAGPGEELEKKAYVTKKMAEVQAQCRCAPGF